MEVSIPQSEFCPLGLWIYARGIDAGACFNSSVGILSVGTSALAGMRVIASGAVSIPQSEFCPLGPSALALHFR